MLNAANALTLRMTHTKLGKGVSFGVQVQLSDPAKSFLFPIENIAYSLGYVMFQGCPVLPLLS